MEELGLKWRLWMTEEMVCSSIFDEANLNPFYADKITAKAQKITIKLPWEITTVYSDILRQSGHQSDDEEDEDDIEAHEASIQRLKVLVPSFDSGTD